MLSIRKMATAAARCLLQAELYFVRPFSANLAVVQFELYELTCNWTMLSMWKFTSIEHDIFKKVTVIQSSISGFAESYNWPNKPSNLSYFQLYCTISFNTFLYLLIDNNSLSGAHASK